MECGQPTVRAQWGASLLGRTPHGGADIDCFAMIDTDFIPAAVQLGDGTRLVLRHVQAYRPVTDREIEFELAGGRQRSSQCDPQELPKVLAYLDRMFHATKLHGL